jgi:hypothetical protein
VFSRPPAIDLDSKGHAMPRSEASPTRRVASVDVARVDLEDQGVRLTLLDGRAVRIPLRPDPSAAQRLRCRLRRVVGVDLQVATDTASAQVRGIGHRVPSTIPVSIETALALAAAGIATTVAILPRPTGVVA